MDGTEREGRARRELSVIESVADGEERDVADCEEDAVGPESAVVSTKAETDPAVETATPQDSDPSPPIPEVTVSHDISDTPDPAGEHSKSASAGTADTASSSQTTATTPDGGADDTAK
jgi:hypothetical protein